MSDLPKPMISPRKTPKQARSNVVVATILEAATRVLATEGAQRFTTARVAEKAGISIGSLYQYFPNKASILFRLQTDEWRQTTDMVHDIFQDRRRPPLDRVRALVRAFIRSECEEAATRIALSDAAPLYRDAPEAKSKQTSGEDAFRTFMAEALPGASDAIRALAADLVATTLSEVGKSFSEEPRTENEIAVYADAMADMFCAYLKQIGCSDTSLTPQVPNR